MTTETPATLAMSAAGISHRVVEYGEVASLEEAARKRGVAVEKVMKSLVVRTGEDQFVMVIVPGDRVIDWPKLRAVVGVSRMSLAPADEALAVTGYPHGAITPFGSKRAIPVICDVSLEGEVSLGGGAHGMSIHLDTADLVALTEARMADVTKQAD
jgi:Cys-tRNA(Pro)/Cys-tRNA(Cys) deacylase